MILSLLGWTDLSNSPPTIAGQINKNRDATLGKQGRESSNLNN
jgi:hypothetical protein